MNWDASFAWLAQKWRMTWAFNKFERPDHFVREQLIPQCYCLSETLFRPKLDNSIKQWLNCPPNWVYFWCFRLLSDLILGDAATNKASIQDQIW